MLLRAGLVVLGLRYYSLCLLLLLFITTNNQVQVVQCFVATTLPVRTKTATRPISTSSSTRLYYDHPSSESDQHKDNNSHDDPIQRHQVPDVDTYSIHQSQEILMDWLFSLKKLERSEPEWIRLWQGQRDLFSLNSNNNNNSDSMSASALIQEQLQSLFYYHPVPRPTTKQNWNAPPTTSTSTRTTKKTAAPTPILFPKESFRAHFDWDWKTCLLKQLPSMDLQEVLQTGQSNTHPLGLQLIALPPHTYLPLEVAAAVTLQLPLLGELWTTSTTASTSTSNSKSESESELLLPADQLCRQPHHCLGTPLSHEYNLSNQPTPEDLQMIGKDVSQRIVLTSSSKNKNDDDVDDVVAKRRRALLSSLLFSNNNSNNNHKKCLQPGECLVHPVGAVHQMFTKETACLVWVLGPMVPANLNCKHFFKRTMKAIQ